MGCVTRIFSILVGIGIIFAGVRLADRGMFGGNTPGSGIPVMLIGAGLLLFIVVVSILGTKWPTTTEILVITIGVILLAIGAGNIKVRVLSAWPVVVCTAGALIALFHRRIVGWVRRAAGFFKPRISGE